MSTADGGPNSGVAPSPPSQSGCRSSVGGVDEGIIRIPEPVGDAACWLGRVCPECGALDESREPAVVCARCGAELPEGER